MPQLELVVELRLPRLHFDDGGEKDWTECLDAWRKKAAPKGDVQQQVSSGDGGDLSAVLLFDRIGDLSSFVSVAHQGLAESTIFGFGKPYKVEPRIWNQAGIRDGGVIGQP